MQETKEQEPQKFPPSRPTARRKKSVLGRLTSKSRDRRLRGRFHIKKVLSWTFLILILLVIDAAYAAFKLRGALDSARQHLEAGSEAARQFNLVLATQEFQAGLGAAESAVLTSKHPAPLLAEHFPVVGPDVDVVRRLAKVAELSASAGLSATEAAQRMNASESLAGAIFSNGQIQFDTIDKGHPQIKEVDGFMSEAAGLVLEAPDPRFGPIKTALDEALARIPSAGETAHKANVLFEALPELFGQGKSLRYLLLFQAPSDQRGGAGGLIGLYGILNATDGRIELAHIGSPYEEGLSPTRLSSTSVPDWYARSYGWGAALTEWQSVTLTANFPVMSQVLLKMYEKETGQQLDGVMAMDPVALAELSKSTGPLSIAEDREPISSGNAVDVLARQVYVEFGDDQLSQNTYLQAVMKDFWAKFSEGNLDPVSLGEGLDAATQGQHFRIWHRDPSTQRQLTTLEAAGDYRAGGPNVQMVFNENAAGNKVDFFLKRSIDSSVTLEDDGSASVATEVSLANSAPEGPPSLLLGPAFSGDPPGLNAMFINFLLPEHATVTEFRLKDQPKQPFRMREGNRPIVSEVILVEAGETETASVAYEFEGAVDLQNDDPSFNYTLWPQQTINPDEYRLTVKAPYGYRLESDSGVLDAGATTLELSGTLNQPVTIQINLETR